MHLHPTNPATAGAGGAPDPFTKMYTPTEIADLWKLSVQSVRRLFQDRAGVLKLGASSPRGKRGYVTLRIPAAVVEQVFRERTQ
jgi:hypothetical protein